VSREDLDGGETGQLKQLQIVALARGSHDALGPESRLGAARVGRRRFHDDVGELHPPSRPEHPVHLPDGGRLVGDEVDHAVADDHVDRVVGKRDVLDRALEELDVLDPGPAQRAAATSTADDGSAGPDGSGLVGVRERAASLGGSASAGPDGRGGFVVRATLPFGAVAS